MLLPVAGCLPVSRGPSGPLPAPEAPLWSSEAMAEHLEFFSELREEGTVPERRSRLTRYLETRLYDFMLQPALRDAYTVPLASSGEMIVMGYVAGRHPVYAYTGVLVWVDIDLSAESGPGLPAVAALLETARRYAAISRYYGIPERTLLFAFSTSGRGAETLGAYLESPTWDVNDTAAIVYLEGRDMGAAGQIEALAEAYELPLYLVPTPSARAPDETGRSPDLRTARAMRVAHVLYETVMGISNVGNDE